MSIEFCVCTAYSLPTLFHDAIGTVTASGSLGFNTMAGGQLRYALGLEDGLVPGPQTMWVSFYDKKCWIVNNPLGPLDPETFQVGVPGSASWVVSG